MSEKFNIEEYRKTATEYRLDPERRLRAKTLKVVEELQLMDDEERMHVFSQFCTHCGSINPNCHCWNDE